MKNFKTFIYLLSLFFFTFSHALEKKWIGRWYATDEWQSEYIIELKENGGAISDYANGEKGKWKIVDGNVKIFWDSGKSDFIFNGVMGMQRLHKSKNKSYTTGIRKIR